jgi:hypothetical protein
MGLTPVVINFWCAVSLSSVCVVPPPRTGMLMNKSMSRPRRVMEESSHGTAHAWLLETANLLSARALDLLPMSVTEGLSYASQPSAAVHNK